MKNKKNKQSVKITANSKNMVTQTLSALHLKPWHIFGLAAIIVLLILSIQFKNNYRQISEDRITMEELNMDKIYFNVFASDIQLGGLTKEQAARKLKRELNFDRTDGRSLYLRTSNGVYEKEITYADMGVEYNIDQLVNDAYNYGRTGSKSERLATVRNLYDVGYFMDPQMLYDEQKIRDFLTSIESEVNSALENGEKLNIDRTVEMIKQQLDIKEFDATIYLPVK